MSAKKDVPTYQMKHHLIGDVAANVLLKLRREAIARRESLMVFQKEAGKSGDRDTARFLKEEAGEAMKEYRSACLLIPWVCAEPMPGDCVYRDLKDFPVELWVYCDRLSGSVYLAQEYA